MGERSGTDMQILARLQRGQTSTAIADELGCSFARIRKIAERNRIQRKSTGGAIAQLTGQRTVLTTKEPRRVTPWARVAVPPGWVVVVVDYEDAEDGVIVLRREEPVRTAPPDAS